MVDPHTKLMTREGYLDLCSEYIARSDRVIETDVPRYRERIFEPIFDLYEEVLTETQEFIDEDPDTDETLEGVTKKLIPILERTRRIGSTDSSNVFRDARIYAIDRCKGFYEDAAAERLCSGILTIMNS